MSVEATPTPKAGSTAQGRRLESWKEIAAYLGRDVTTVRRWEKGEGLPVHRHLHNKLGSVYAFTTELDSWRSNRAPTAVTDAPDTHPGPESVRLGRHGRMAAVLAAITLILAAGVIWLVRARTGKPAASVAIRSLAVLPLANFSGNSRTGLSVGRHDRGADRAAFDDTWPASDFAHFHDAVKRHAQVRAGHWKGVKC